MTTTARTNEELFHRSIGALNDRDREAFVEAQTEDVVLHDNDEDLHGVDAVVEHEWTSYEAFPDMEYAIETVVANDDTVAARWTASGTHESEFEGIPPTGEEVQIPASGTFRVEDGKIAEVWLTYDRFGMLRQLGVDELPGE